MAEGSPAARYAPVSDVDLQTYSFTASKGKTTGVPLGYLVPFRLYTGVTKEAHIDPYTFRVANDTMVAVDSQNLMETIASDDNPELDHGAIKEDALTAEKVFAVLDDRSAVPYVTFGMPGNISNEQGIPREGRGRGVSPVTGLNLDAVAFEHQCRPGGPMNSLMQP